MTCFYIIHFGKLNYIQLPISINYKTDCPMSAILRESWLWTVLKIVDNNNTHLLFFVVRNEINVKNILNLIIMRVSLTTTIYVCSFANIPWICLSGSGGIGIIVNFSTNRSCNQSKCLYLLDTCILLNWG